MSTQYTIQFEALNDTEFKGVQTVYTKTVDDMLKNVRHGVHIVFLQSGQLGVFDFPTLLLAIVGGIGINAGIVFVIDIIATRFVSTKEVNDNLKYNRTADIKAMSRDEIHAFVSRLQKATEELYDVSHVEVTVDSNDPECSAVLLKRSKQSEEAEDDHEYKPVVELNSEADDEHSSQMKTDHTD